MIYIMCSLALSNAKLTMEWAWEAGLKMILPESNCKWLGTCIAWPLW